MVNKVRIFLIFAVLGVISLSSYQYFSKFSTPIGQVNLKPLESGVDIEIENFKLVNEDASSKTWELTADRAQVLRDETRTELKNVELKLRQEGGQDFRISADNGVMQNEGQDIQLEGHVRLVGQPRVLLDHIETPAAKPAG